MNWTRTDAIRRWIVVAGLIVGPALLVASAAVDVSRPAGSIREEFDATAANPGIVIVVALLETLGFMVVLAVLAGSTQALRSRGGALGTAGAILCIVGIVGFSLSNAGGFTIAELAQLPDRDAGFTTAGALMSSDIAGATGTLGMAMEILGELGILLVVGGLIRARLIPLWPLLLLVVGVVINLVVGDALTTLIADVLLLGAGCWIAVKLARASGEAWLGMPAPGA